jgi:hypothetical protein
MVLTRSQTTQKNNNNKDNYPKKYSNFYIFNENGKHIVDDFYFKSDNIHIMPAKKYNKQPLNYSKSKYETLLIDEMKRQDMFEKYEKKSDDLELKNWIQYIM